MHRPLSFLALLALAGCGSAGHAHPEMADGAAAPRAPAPSQASADVSGEEYVDHGVNPWTDAASDDLSTFAIDVDTGSFTNARRLLRDGVLPPPAAVRTEEFVNFLRAADAPPASGAFAVASEAVRSPVRESTVLRVGLRAFQHDQARRPRANLVFLVDTSGSMSSPDKLGLVKESLALLVRALRPDDLVGICTYAGGTELVLPPTPAREREEILDALVELESGGGTAMASGMELAYRLAAQNHGQGVSSRVIVCSDGDANIGATSHDAILARIASFKERGITLGTVGFGTGNYRDHLMEQLADRGDGSYAYVDSLVEARRLFSEDLASSLTLVARDVKVQVAFDPARVARYRLLGYENREVADEDFRDDRVDGGEVGAGHAVTALYELELVPESEGSFGAVHLRYHTPDRGAVREESVPLVGEVRRFEEGSQPTRFRVLTAEFAEVLRQSPHTQTRLETLVPLVESNLAAYDEREHSVLDMVRRAAVLSDLD